LGKLGIAQAKKGELQPRLQRAIHHPTPVFNQTAAEVFWAYGFRLPAVLSLLLLL
jgi:hypothetical protein